MACRRWICVLFLGLAVAMTPGLAQSPAQTNQAGGAATRAQNAGAAELEKVERLIAARRDYQLALEQLRFHYHASGDIERMHWAEDELKEFHRISKRAYVLDLDVPPPNLKPLYPTPQANEIYRQAMAYKAAGGWGKDFIDNQRRAELLFQRILTEFPQCDRIDDCAYQLGDLYEGKAYVQYRRAALYFERCFQWNPKTHFDARLRAARIYDKQLQERTRAIELYREITIQETDPKRLAEASKRLTDLSLKK